MARIERKPAQKQRISSLENTGALFTAVLSFPRGGSHGTVSAEIIFGVQAISPTYADALNFPPPPPKPATTTTARLLPPSLRARASQHPSPALSAPPLRSPPLPARQPVSLSGRLPACQPTIQPASQHARRQACQPLSPTPAVIVSMSFLERALSLTLCRPLSLSLALALSLLLFSFAHSLSLSLDHPPAISFSLSLAFLCVWWLFCWARQGGGGRRQLLFPLTLSLSLSRNPATHHFVQPGPHPSNHMCLAA